MISKNPQPNQDDSTPAVLKNDVVANSSPQVTEHPIDTSILGNKPASEVVSNATSQSSGQTQAAGANNTQPSPAGNAADVMASNFATTNTVNDGAPVAPEVLSNQMSANPNPGLNTVPVTDGGVQPEPQSASQSWGVGSPATSPSVSTGPQPTLEQKAKDMVSELDKETKAMQKGRGDGAGSGNGKKKNLGVKAALVGVLLLLVGAGAYAGINLLGTPGSTDIRQQAAGGACTPDDGIGCWTFICPLGCGGDGACTGDDPGAQFIQGCESLNGRCGQVDVFDENQQYVCMMELYCPDDPSLCGETHNTPTPTASPTPTEPPAEAPACTGVTGTLMNVNGSAIDEDELLSFTATATGDGISKIELCFHGNFEGPGWGTGWTCLRDASPADGSFPSSQTDPGTSDFAINGDGTFTYGMVKQALIATGHDATQLDQSGVRWGVNIFGAGGACFSNQPCGNSCVGTFGLQPPAPTETPTPTPINSPTPTPTTPPSQLACIEISADNTAPELGDKVTFSCEGTPEEDVVAAEFQYSINDGGTWVGLANLPNNQLQAALTVTNPGTYQVRCRVCDAGNTCTAWQTAN